MNIGDYVRILTLSGQSRIAKLEKIDDICITDKGGVDKNNIIKSSPNIIDLIEIGDYVNGEEVYMGEECGEPCLMIPATPVKFCGIESIVTKEQFASMEYKLKED